MDRLFVSSNKKRGLDGRYGRRLALCFADYLLNPCVVLGNVDACLLFHVVYGIIDEGVVIKGRGCLITLPSDLSDMFC